MIRSGRKNNLNTNINSNTQLKIMQIPSNISSLKETSAGVKMEEICKLIIKRLDRIDKRYQEMIANRSGFNPTKTNI